MSLCRIARKPHLQHISPQFTTTGTSRSFYQSSRRMVKPAQLSISAGEDNGAVLDQTTKLVDSGKWTLCNDGKGLERPFKFKTFKATWDFMNHVAGECKKQKHHPELSNVYNKTHIRWTTHSPEGLSSKDTHMAAFCDQTAQEFHELDIIDPSEGKLGADGKIEAGDCCTPNKKL